MNKNNVIRKGLVIAIIVLFFGMCIPSSIIGVEETTSFSSGIVVQPPVVIEIDGILGDNGWYVSCATITMEATSGNISYIMYKIDDGDWQTYTTPFVICEDGIYLLCWYYVDNEGNQSDIECIEIKIDQTPPTTTHEFSGIMGDNEWYTSDVEVTLTATDVGGAGVNYTRYMIDSGNWINYTGNPFYVTGDGNHTIYYYSVDLAGNEEDVNEAGLKIDKTSPKIRLTVEKIDFSTWLFTADVSDETSGIAKVEFYVNGEYLGNVTEYPYEWIYNATFSTGFSVKGLIINPKFTEETVSFFAVIAIGRHSIPDCPVGQAIAYDNAGNQGINPVPNPPIYIDYYFYIFEQLTFSNNYSGDIGRFFINAVFEDFPS